MWKKITTRKINEIVLEVFEKTIKKLENHEHKYRKYKPSKN